MRNCALSKNRGGAASGKVCRASIRAGGPDCATTATRAISRGAALICRETGFFTAWVLESLGVTEGASQQGMAARIDAASSAAQHALPHGGSTEATNIANAARTRHTALRLTICPTGELNCIIPQSVWNARTVRRGFRAHVCG